VSRTRPCEVAIPKCHHLREVRHRRRSRGATRTGIAVSRQARCQSARRSSRARTHPLCRRPARTISRLASPLDGTGITDPLQRRGDSGDIRGRGRSPVPQRASVSERAPETPAWDDDRAPRPAGCPLPHPRRERESARPGRGRSQLVRSERRRHVGGDASFLGDCSTLGGGRVRRVRSWVLVHVRSGRRVRRVRLGRGVRGRRARTRPCRENDHAGREEGTESLQGSEWDTRLRRAGTTASAGRTTSSGGS